MENNQCILDSSVWVALFLSTDSQYNKATSLLRKLGDIEIVVPHDIAKEVMSVLLKRKSPDKAAIFWDYINNEELVTVMTDHEQFYEAGQIFVENIKYKLSFVDASLVVYSKKYQVPTFKKITQHPSPDKTPPQV